MVWCSSSRLSANHGESDVEDSAEGQRSNVDLLGVWRSGSNRQLAQELCASGHDRLKDLCSSIRYIWCAVVVHSYTVVGYYASGSRYCVETKKH